MYLLTLIFIVIHSLHDDYMIFNLFQLHVVNVFVISVHTWVICDVCYLLHVLFANCAQRILFGFTNRQIYIRWYEWYL